MPRGWLIEFKKEFDGLKVDYSDPKEDYYTLKGLFLGTYFVEEWHDIHVLKRVRVYDTLL